MLPYFKAGGVPNHKINMLIIEIKVLLRHLIGWHKEEHVPVGSAVMVRFAVAIHTRLSQKRAAHAYVLGGFNLSKCFWLYLVVHDLRPVVITG